MKKPLVAVLAASAFIALAAPAWADSSVTGTAGALTLFTPSSDTQSYDGSLGVSVTNGGWAFYWGGTSCAAYTTLSTTQIQLLANAAAEKRSVTIYYKGPSQCIVGFTIRG